VASDTTPVKAPVRVRSLEVRFTALDFAAPEEIRFRHKLEGLDSDWVDDAGLRVARYGTLLYGRYRFHLAARRADGPWQEAADTFAFVVPTPLYFQTWAICLYIVAAIAVIAGTVRMVSHRRLRFALARLEQQQALERERMRIARDMHDEMGSKLTKISFLSEHVQVASATQGPVADRIEQIAETSRDLLKTMDEIVWVVNPVNDTLENLTTYLSHYAVEYFQNTSIECELRLPPDIPHSPLSSEARHNLFLTFEEVLNNVLKHSAASHVKVDVGVRQADFEITVTDDGKGFEVPPSSNGEVRSARGGNGLRNMRQRLSAIGGECLISSQPGAGTRVTLRFALTKPNSP
jgi:signal transduction histidine kinase